jgi:hypothetical protein
MSSGNVSASISHDPGIQNARWAGMVGLAKGVVLKNSFIL